MTGRTWCSNWSSSTATPDDRPRDPRSMPPPSLREGAPPNQRHSMRPRHASSRAPPATDTGFRLNGLPSSPASTTGTGGRLRPAQAETGHRLISLMEPACNGALDCFPCSFIGRIGQTASAVDVGYREWGRGRTAVRAVRSGGRPGNGRRATPAPSASVHGAGFFEIVRGPLCDVGGGLGRSVGLDRKPSRYRAAGGASNTEAMSSLTLTEVSGEMATIEPARERESDSSKPPREAAGTARARAAAPTANADSRVTCRATDHSKAACARSRVLNRPLTSPS